MQQHRSQALLLISVTAIEFGGTSLHRTLSRKYSEFTEFQRSMFQGGHASARLRNGAEQVSSLLEAAIKSYSR
jgi:hypothetical protein